MRRLLLALLRIALRWHLRLLLTDKQLRLRSMLAPYLAAEG